MRRRILVLAVGAVVGLVGMQAAFAAVTSHVSIAHNAKTQFFHGKVSSSNTECQSGRTVRLYKKTSSGSSLEGKTLSTKSGGWKIEVMHAHGHYFAKIPTEKIMNTSCGGAKSKTVAVT